MTDAIAAQPGWFLLVDYGDGRKFAREPIIGWDLAGPTPKPITLAQYGLDVGLYYLRPDGHVIEPGGDQRWNCEGQWKTAMLKARGVLIPEHPRPPTHSVMP